MSRLLALLLTVAPTVLLAQQQQDSSHPRLRQGNAATSSNGNLSFQRRNLDADVILGVSPKEFEQILSSDIRDEFGIDEVGIERAQELWEAYADFELARAVAAEESYRAGREEEATLSDMHFPYLLCSRKAGKSGLQRKQQIIDIIRYTLNSRDREEAEIDVAANIFTIYNSEEQSCFGARFAASTALVFASLKDPELPILPIHFYLKMREGSVQEMLRRAFPEYDANGEADENFHRSDSVSSSKTRLEAKFCAGLSEEERKRMGFKLMSFMTAKSSTETGKSMISAFNKYAGVTPGEYDNLPARVRFWLKVYRLGIDSEDGCKDMLDRIIWEVVPGSAAGEARGFYASLGPPTEKTETKTTVACALSLFAGIALQPQVCSVELNPLISVSNFEAQWILQDHHTEERPFWDAGITGKGQVVGVSDSGLETNNCYFYDATGDIRKDGSTDLTRRKVIQYEPYVDTTDDEGGHGTHVCGTIVGHKAEDGRTESSGFADGVAKDAKVAFFDAGGGGDGLAIPGDKSKFLGVGKSAGAQIHSASWGSMLLPYRYDTMTSDIDQYIYEDWDFLLIVAAGNEGSGNADRTITSPAVGKNVLTVGASQSTTNRGIDYLADFSSRGPTSDGRIKPDVVAPGQSILSSYADLSVVGECDPDRMIPTEGITYMQGTSMATPATSGAAALVRQYFLDGHFPSESPIDPSGMLLKAILINGAQEIAYIDNGALQTTRTSYYDGNQGFGRVSLIDSLPLHGSNRFNASFIDRGTINAGEEMNIQINITKSGNLASGCTLNQMRTTLVWADPPGAAGCTKCLINDLDLSLTKNDNPTVYYPNGRAKKDDRNNVERIIVDAQDGDEIHIKINAANLDRAEQAYALVITGCMEAKNYIGEAQPMASSNRARNIVIVVCTVVGSIIVLGLCWMLLSSGEKKRQERRRSQQVGIEGPSK